MLRSTLMKEASQAIGSFLKSDTARVLVLKGPWGSGKTYYWKELAKTLTPPGNITKYAYVSLFGASSTMEIYNSIIAKTVVWERGKLGDAKRIATLPVKGLLKLLGMVEIPHFSGTQLVADLAVERLVCDHLICFDDLERKSENLSADIFVGMVSQLTEQKRCKIILIYNDQEVKDGSLTKAISSARDKLIDYEVRFEPRVEDNLKIVSSSLLEQYGRGKFVAVGNRNIRIMTRTAEALKYFHDRYGTKHQEFVGGLLNRVAILSLVHFAYAQDFTLEDFADNDISSSFGPRLRKKEEPVEPRIAAIRAVAEKLQYLCVDWEEPIRDFLKNGYLDAEAADSLFAQIESKHRFDALNSEHSQIWWSYHHSFATTQEEFVARHFDFINRHAEDLRVSDVYSAVEILRMLMGNTPELQAILDRAIAASPKHIGPRDLSDMRLERLPPEIRSIVIAMVKESRSKRDLGELMESLGGSSDYNPSDAAELAMFTTDDLVDWLKTDKERATLHIADTFLQRTLDITTHGAPDAAQKLLAALDILKGRSKFDEMRVENFAVKNYRRIVAQRADEQAARAASQPSSPPPSSSASV